MLYFQYKVDMHSVVHHISSYCAFISVVLSVCKATNSCPSLAFGHGMSAVGTSFFKMSTVLTLSCLPASQISQLAETSMQGTNRVFRAIVSDKPAACPACKNLHQYFLFFPWTPSLTPNTTASLRQNQRLVSAWILPLKVASSSCAALDDPLGSIKHAWWIIQHLLMCPKC